MVTGSRTWRDADVINEVLAEVWHLWGCPADPILVSGKCKRGADAIAERLWTARGFEVEPYPAQWSQHGPDCPEWCRRRADLCVLAGPRRDCQMVDTRPDGVVSFLAVCQEPKCRYRPKLGEHFSHGAMCATNYALEQGLPVRMHFDTGNDQLPRISSLVVPGRGPGDPDHGVRLTGLAEMQSTLPL
jgi:hypothetical protein